MYAGSATTFLSRSGGRLAPSATPAIVAAAILIAITAPPAHAADAVCPPSLGAVVVSGDLRVVAICRIEGTVVQGDVQIFSGGSLAATDAVIKGNIEGTRADSLTLFDSVVDGNVKLVNFVGVLTRISLSRIDGNLELRDHWSRLELQDNRIDGNVEVQHNTGGAVIIDNVIDGNLICSGNTPRPVGSGNRVSGNVQGQCVNLRPGGIDQEPADGEPSQSPPPAPPAPEPPAPVTPEDSRRVTHRARLPRRPRAVEVPAPARWC
jgi:hypothetical protein